MMKLGLCCCGGLCCALLGGLLALGGGPSMPGQAAETADCGNRGCREHAAKAPCPTPAEPATDVELTDDEQQVVRYLADRIVAGKAPSVTSDLLEKRVGLSIEAIEQLDQSKLRAGVMAELSRRGFDLASLGGNCSRYKACSVDRNLMNATGEELERYEREVAMDGAIFSDRVAPDFTLPDTEGRQISLADYRGHDVVVVFLSAHCYHSLDTLPILADLRKKYDEELTILPVFINSGGVEDVSSRAWESGLEYPLLVSEGKAISEAYESRMVPSTFLIDERGRLIRRLVGFKDGPTLERAFDELVGS